MDFFFKKFKKGSRFLCVNVMFWKRMRCNLLTIITRKIADIKLHHKHLVRLLM